VVAAVVLDVEVAVARLRQRHLREAPFDLLALVAQLVGGVDGDAADGTDREGQADRRERRGSPVVRYHAAHTRPAYWRGRNR